ncbi:hypothetical protein DFJ74DRAFT_332612 [Hyaloraphidium curvatum]|nr:hypothetical protein DFJ74DRAFT_332612 [Hyaloraphidium curvatum]
MPAPPDSVLPRAERNAYKAVIAEATPPGWRWPVPLGTNPTLLRPTSFYAVNIYKRLDFPPKPVEELPSDVVLRVDPVPLPIVPTADPRHYEREVSKGPWSRFFDRCRNEALAELVPPAERICAVPGCGRKFINSFAPRVANDVTFRFEITDHLAPLCAGPGSRCELWAKRWFETLFSGVEEQLDHEVAIAEQCLNCGREERKNTVKESFKRCSRCRRAVYCSEKCQREDWKVHKKHCTPAAELAEARKELGELRRELSGEADAEAAIQPDLGSAVPEIGGGGGGPVASVFIVGQAGREVSG